jgi:hypothetical protein
MRTAVVSAPLPSALFVELMAPVPVGVLNFNGAAISNRTDCLLSGS